MVNEEELKPKNVIATFDGEYRFLSNFYEEPIQYKGYTYMSSESAYQAQKCPSRAEDFTGLKPMKAKKLARKVPIREDWEEVKYGIMVELVRAKFTQNSKLTTRLTDTGDTLLEEGNYWNDTYWGVCNGVGENNLGKILMLVRDELKVGKT